MTNMIEALKSNNLIVSDFTPIASALLDAVVYPHRISLPDADFVTELAVVTHDDEPCIRMSLLRHEEGIISSGYLYVRNVTLADLASCIGKNTKTSPNACAIVFGNTPFYSDMANIKNLTGKHALVGDNSKLTAWADNQVKNDNTDATFLLYTCMNQVMEWVEENMPVAC